MNGTTEGRKPLHVPGRKVCAACGRVLDYHEGRGWEHPLDPTLLDHPAIPVDDTEVPVNEKCDFCFSDGTEWILPARAFQVGPNHGSQGDWAACSPCAELVRKDDWNGLMRRVKEMWPGHLGTGLSPDGELWLRRTYRALRKNRTGALRKIEP